MAAAVVVFLFAGPLGAQAAGSTVHGSGYLLNQMDRDMNGTVSKEEFLDYMGRTFERLDTNHSGKLGPGELRPLVGAKWNRIHPAVR